MVWNLILNAGGRVLSDVDWKDIFDRATGLRMRAAQNSAAHVVSAINAVMPSDRQPWTQQGLFAFVAAFVKVARHPGSPTASVEWIKPPPEVVALILRGSNIGDDRDALERMLLEECNEIFETLPLMAQHERDAEFPPIEPVVGDESDADDPDAKAATKDPLSRRFRLSAFFFGPIATVASAAPAIGRVAKAKFMTEKRHLRDKQIVRILAAALLRGGLSTMEARNVLLAQGIESGDIDSALREGIPDNG